MFRGIPPLDREGKTELSSTSHGRNVLAITQANVHRRRYSEGSSVAVNDILPPSPNVADVTQKRRSEIISTRAPVKLGLIGIGAMWPSSHKSKRKSGMLLDQTPATAIPRPLGALEKLFWLADQYRPVHFAIAAEIGGSTRIEQWQDALDRVCRQSALIWSRIVPDERGAPVFTPVPHGSIPLHVVENATSEWTAHVAGQLDQPFDASRAPLLRATLLHGADRSVIILCAHHSMADGLALSVLMRDVLRAFAGERVRVSAETASIQHLVAAK